MPKVAEIVDRMRVQLGQSWVDQCIASAVKGTPDQFYAVERGHIVGTPFTLDTALNDQVRLCFMVGGAGAVVRQPVAASGAGNSTDKKDGNQ